MTANVTYKHLLFLFGFTLLFDITYSDIYFGDNFPFGPNNNPLDQINRPGFPFSSPLVAPHPYIEPNPFQNTFSTNLQNNLDNTFSSFNDKMKKFQQNLNKHLKDVNYKTSVIGTVSQMARGIGGTTILTYNGKQVIVKDNVFGLCNGKIITDNANYVQCNGQITYDTENDICRPIRESVARVNNYMCIGDPKTSNSLQVTTINGNVDCKNGVLFSKAEFEKQCGPNAFSNNYARITYIPDRNNPNHIPMPNENPYLPCMPRNAPYCEFTTDYTGIGSGQTNSITNSVTILS